MERIASFSVDHLLLEPGVYVSRIDRDPATGAAVTTFDLRLTTPNKEPVMNTAECHTIEHLGATFLRNHAEWSSRIVYFGPMGCRTGFYLVVFGEVTSEEILPLVRELFEFVAGFEGDVPGAAPEECGNYLDQNLPMANWLARRYLDRDLADRRIFPAIDPVASGTRNEDLLVDEQMRPFVFGLRRILAGMNNTERAAASFIKGLKGTNTNQEFLVRSAKKHSDYEQTF